jgi:hypothetical protein
MSTDTVVWALISRAVVVLSRIELSHYLRRNPGGRFQPFDTTKAVCFRNDLLLEHNRCLLDNILLCYTCDLRFPALHGLSRRLDLSPRYSQFSDG